MRVHSQIALHERHGGVVPIWLPGNTSVKLPHCSCWPGAEPGLARLTNVAVTYGPGLAPCLAMGGAAAKALSQSLRLPLVGVNHLRAHAWSPFIGMHNAAQGNLTNNSRRCCPILD